jgi:hypothetical protein
MGTEETDLPKLAAPARRALMGAGYTRLEHLTEVKESEVMRLHGMGPNALRALRAASRSAACPSALDDTHGQRGRIARARGGGLAAVAGSAALQQPHGSCLGWWRTVAVRAYGGVAEVHVSLRTPQVELVPCRRRQIASAWSIPPR